MKWCFAQSTDANAPPPELAEARRAAWALALFALPAILFALIPLLLWSNEGAEYFLLVINGALVGMLSASATLCISTASVNPARKLSIMVWLNLVASVFYSGGGLGTILFVGGERLDALFDGTACGVSVPQRGTFGSVALRCEQVAHPIALAVIIDAILGLVAAVCHVMLAYLGHQARLQLAARRATERTALKLASQPV